MADVVQCRIVLHENLLRRHPYDAQCEEYLAPTWGNLYGDTFASMPIYLLLGLSTDCILYHGTRNSNSSATIFSMAQREKSLEPSR
jgi:hypothetical protein